MMNEGLCRSQTNRWGGDTRKTHGKHERFCKVSYSEDLGKGAGRGSGSGMGVGVVGKTQNRSGGTEMGGQSPPADSGSFCEAEGLVSEAHGVEP